MFISEQLLSEGDKFTLTISLIDDEDVLQWYEENDCPVLTVDSITDDLVWTKDYDCPYALDIEYITKYKLEDVIMDEIHFSFYKDNCKYNVYVASVDDSDSDQYYVSVVSPRADYATHYYCDSVGGLCDDSELVCSDEILSQVHDFLFTSKKQTIVKGF